MPQLADQSFVTESGITILRSSRPSDYETGTSEWIDRLDSERGAVLASSYEYPGRYTRWDMALVNPPLVMEAADRTVEIRALNDRGKILMPAISKALKTHEDVEHFAETDERIDLTVKKPDRDFQEEERSRQPSTFSIVRALKGPVCLRRRSARPLRSLRLRCRVPVRTDRPEAGAPRRPARRRAVPARRDPDRRPPRQARLCAWNTSSGRRREHRPDCRATASAESLSPAAGIRAAATTTPGEYAELVRAAKDYFRAATCSRPFRGRRSSSRAPAAPRPSPAGSPRSIRRPTPSSSTWATRNIWSGRSPEMYVRVTGGRRVETCPISGTIRRGKNAIEDEAQIRKLLNSKPRTRRN
jgi:anthranilate synthase